MDLSELGLARGWPGDQAVVQWKVPDPMEFTGRINGRRNQFRAALASLAKRIDLLTALRQEKIMEARIRHQAG
jgi:hypothetical protein